MNMRLGFIVKAKATLIESLKSQGNDLHEFFSENYILATEEHDYEAGFEGYRISILNAAKNTFIKNTIIECLELDSDELQALFGSFDTNVDLFDKWWILESADCDIIPTTWLGA